MWVSHNAIAPPLIDGLAFGALIADTAFDSYDIFVDLNERGAKAVIAQHPRRMTPLDIDAEMYKWRHLIENFFCKLKEFKRIQRDEHIQMIRDKGRLGWQKTVGYGRRSLGETAMFRYKTVIGRGLRARTLPAQKTEARVGCAVLNRMTRLGMPVSQRIA
jgi:hypothetical protein